MLHPAVQWVEGDTGGFPRRAGETLRLPNFHSYFTSQNPELARKGHRWGVNHQQHWSKLGSMREEVIGGNQRHEKAEDNFHSLGNLNFTIHLKKTKQKHPQKTFYSSRFNNHTLTVMCFSDSVETCCVRQWIFRRHVIFLPQQHSVTWSHSFSSVPTPLSVSVLGLLGGAAVAPLLVLLPVFGPRPSVFVVSVPGAGTRAGPGALASRLPLSPALLAVLDTETTSWCELDLRDIFSVSHDMSWYDFTL